MKEAKKRSATSCTNSVDKFNARNTNKLTNQQKEKNMKKANKGSAPSHKSNFSTEQLKEFGRKIYEAKKISGGIEDTEEIDSSKQYLDKIFLKGTILKLIMSAYGNVVKGTNDGVKTPMSYVMLNNGKTVLSVNAKLIDDRDIFLNFELVGEEFIDIDEVYDIGSDLLNHITIIYPNISNVWYIALKQHSMTDEQQIYISNKLLENHSIYDGTQQYICCS